jgi:glucose/arabinose dehydrogenase
MKKPVILISTLVVAAALIWGGLFYWQNLCGAGPALLPPSADIAAQIPAKPPPEGHNPPDPASRPLKLPQGFTISIFSSHLPGARVLAAAPDATLLVSLTRSGRVVALPDKNQDGQADKVVTILHGLNNPHGLAFGPEKPPRLYVAETDKVAVYDYDPKHFKASHKHKIVDLPPGRPPFHPHPALSAAASAASPVDFRGLRLQRLRGKRLALR